MHGGQNTIEPGPGTNMSVQGREGYDDRKVAELLTQFRRTEDERLRREIVEEMRPLVRSVARKFAGREPLEDLESEGFVGLLRAIDRFTPERGARFSTFAVHLIAGQIRHYLRDRGHLIRQPAWLQELDRRVRRATADLEQRLHRAPSTEEIARAANLSEEGVEELVAARQAAQTIRLEAPTDQDDDYLEVDPEKFRSREYVTLALPIEDRIVLEGTLEKLKELEKKVLYYFFFHEFNQSEIARTLGISCNYTGHVLRNGLKHMREKHPEPNGAEAGETATVTDRTTGLYTLRHFENRVTEEISRAQRYEQSFAVCCLLLPSGTNEATMREAANQLRRRTRKADVAARVGITEFGLIFPNTSEAAVEVATRLASELREYVGGTIHASAVVYPAAGRHAATLITAAIEAAHASDPARAYPALDAEPILINAVQPA